jgi:CpeT protein
MVGSFSSESQAAADPENYRDIRLQMVRIWPKRTDGRWLYVEQAAGTALAKPYRQRVYNLVSLAEPLADGSTIRSDVYELPGDPLTYAGAWKTPETFDALTPDTLDLREGCSIFLRQDADGLFRGSTQGNGCSSSLAGASYATSEAIITPAGLQTWDRGFFADGTQAWGATKGAYVFVRQK